MNGHEAPRTGGLPLLLPPKIPLQRYRQAQSNIPDDRRVRNLLKKKAEERVQNSRAVPPLAVSELRSHAAEILGGLGLEAKYENYAAILVNNAAWRDSLASIPFDRRLLLLPKCLRVEDRCPAPFDEFGLLCKECGLCSIQDLSVEAERLGYAVLVAEGSAIVRQLIEARKIEAIIGVSCINVLEKCFPHLEAAAIPGAAIPLLQDDCVNTTVDLDWVWDLIHLTSKDKTYRLDLDALKDEIRGWFTPDALESLMGPAREETEKIAREWLTKDGKRWRPFLAACAYLALEQDRTEGPALASEDLKKTAAAIECFHKASLVHDDIEDGDEERYKDKSLHAQVGVPVALNEGDYLLGEGYRLLGELAALPAVRVEMLRTASAGHLTLSRGQGRELLWNRSKRPLSSVEVLEIFRDKTAPAFGVALGLGALLAGADDETREVLEKYSTALGIAYQIKDDLEDRADLAKPRPSLLLAIASKRAEGAEKELVDAVAVGRLAYQDAAGELERILNERGVLRKAGELLEAYKEDAVRSLRFLSNPTLKGLLRRVVGKIFGEHLIEGYCSEFEARNAANRAAGAGPSGGVR